MQKSVFLWYENVQYEASKPVKLLVDADLPGKLKCAVMVLSFWTNRCG